MMATVIWFLVLVFNDADYAVMPNEPQFSSLEECRLFRQAVLTVEGRLKATDEYHEELAMALCVARETGT